MVSDGCGLDTQLLRAMSSQTDHLTSLSRFLPWKMGEMSTTIPTAQGSYTD